MDTNGMREGKAHFLPNHVGFFNTNSSESLVKLLSKDIAEILESSIQKEGRASFAVSGGRTPIPLFVELSKLNLDWSKVELTLADDRWLDSDHEASNERLVRKYLLKNKAINASFIPLKSSYKTARIGQIHSEKIFKEMKLPLDVIVLGMGSDGHTASLFPCSDELTEAMNTNYPNFLISTNPKTAPYERISLSAKTISNSKKIFLYMNGSEKLRTLEAAMHLKDINKMPIYNFLKEGLDIYWSP